MLPLYVVTCLAILFVMVTFKMASAAGKAVAQWQPRPPKMPHIPWEKLAPKERPLPPPKPPCPAEEMEKARQKYEAKVAMIETLNLDEFEKEALLAHAKQVLFTELARWMK